jgi:hypothetical protein
MTVPVCLSVPALPLSGLGAEPEKRNALVKRPDGSRRAIYLAKTNRPADTHKRI